MPGLYFPRMLANLSVPVMGDLPTRIGEGENDDVISYDVQVLRASWESNDHNTADALEITVDYADAGCDPRLLSNAEVTFWLGQADPGGGFTPTRDNLRFIGIATEVQRVTGEEDRKVTIKALDYTTLFLKAKPFPADGIPDLGMTLSQAFRRICDYTGPIDITTTAISSSVGKLRDKPLVFVGSAQDVVIGKAVSQRFAALSKVQSNPDDDAWAIWQRCCGMLSFITFIRADEVIVTTATDYYTAADPPRFIHGRNVKEISEKRDTDALSAKGVALTSWNGVSGTIESFYPSKLDLQKKKKSVKASALSLPQAAQVKEYDYFTYPYATDQAALDAVCQRVYEERSRQELTGELETEDMFVPTVSGAVFDVLRTSAGDRIRVEIDQDSLSAITRLQTVEERAQFLYDRGYKASLAFLMAKNITVLKGLSPEFQVRSVRTEFEVNDDTGSYSSHIEFINRIEEITGPAGSSSSDTPEQAAERTFPGLPVPKVWDRDALRAAGVDLSGDRKAK